MHLLFRETRALDAVEAAIDLGQSPAELVFLSFSESDLGAAARAWQEMGEGRPSLRLANLAQLRHPMSVDLYLERVVARARAVLVRILGGIEYWRYGAEEIFHLCRARGIALALLPGDAAEDATLAQLSTIAPAIRARLDAYLRAGGVKNLAHALRLAAHLGGLGREIDDPPEELAQFGELARWAARPQVAPVGEAALVFYRSHHLAGDLAPITALGEALAARGLGVRGFYVNSLKDHASAAFIAETLRAMRPAVVINATGFAARGAAATSPLDAADVPVLQVVLAGSSRESWQNSARGLSAADLAMQVVLPELDGRLLTTAISFKAPEPAIETLEYARSVHAPDAAGIALAADRAAGWARLAATPRASRRVAFVLSDYPAMAGQAGHAIGLDTIASLDACLDSLDEAGYFVPPRPASLARELCDLEPAPFLKLADYNRLFAELPAPVQEAIAAYWGDALADQTVREGWFTLRYLRSGNIIAAIQPDRGTSAARKARYHDPDEPPHHAYVAFYLWLRREIGLHALVHLGAHGTLEWLPGKAAALSETCFPRALLGGLPLIYPFIVNNPGEAAVAKRRLGAVVVGHLTPPLTHAGLAGPAAEIERLIEEYADAAGLDPRRAAVLRGDILSRAQASGLLAECGIAPLAPEEEALARLDAYLCDVKESQIRDGLHTFARAPSVEIRSTLLRSLAAAAPSVDPADLARRLDASPAAERAALLAALDGRFIAPGPAGAPSRGRLDVLPTGRNLYSVDPRVIPTRSACALAAPRASLLLQRHMQEHGTWLHRLVLDLWGSASMRTGGEEFALALHLMGARVLWDAGSHRVSGIEVLPLAVLDRPRVDVTLRISGLFRDAFATQIVLFDEAVRMIAARAEDDAWNPLAAAARAGENLSRIYGAAPGAYGAGVGALADHGDWQSSDDLARAYLDASAHAYGGAAAGVRDEAGLAARIASAEAFLHTEDHAESDLLESIEFAAHEGGFAAAARLLGQTPALYHADTSRPAAPRVATLGEAIARVTRARAANPRWIAGQMRHGYRGAAEITRAVEALFVFAATIPSRLDGQFDLLFAATLGDGIVDRFLKAENPAARKAMAARFLEAQRRGLWRPRSNTTGVILGEIEKQ